MTVSQIENMSQIFLLLAILFLALSVVLFYIFKIRRICKIVSGKYAKETKITSFKYENDNIQKSFLASVNDKEDEILKNKTIVINKNSDNDGIHNMSDETIGFKSTELISDTNDINSAITILMSKNNKIEDEYDGIKGSDTTQLLSDEEVRILQDIKYSNCN